MKAFRCKATLDNGATIEDKDLIVFAENIGYVHFIVDKILCKTYEDVVTRLIIEEIEVAHGDAFVIVDELKGGTKGEG